MFNTILIILSSIVSFGEFERLKRTAVGNKWPQSTIPYVISESYANSDREFIEKTIRELESKVAINGINCIKFVPRDNQKSYISFQDADRCSSNIGYFPGLNTIRLSKNGCIRKGIILHEIMHGWVYYS